MFKIQIVGDPNKISDNIRSLGTNAHDIFIKAMQRCVIRLQTKIKFEKLSNQILKYGSPPRLRDSIVTDVQDSGNYITGTVSSNVIYAPIQEYGGTVNLPDIYPKNASCLAFVWNGKQCFFKKINAHSITIPAHYYMRDSLNESKNSIKEEFDQAVKELISKAGGK
jgi:phage gpG-like protein